MNTFVRCGDLFTGREDEAQPGGMLVFDGPGRLLYAGAEAGAHFGAAVAGPGDINQGGRDLIIGAPLDDADGNATDDALDRGRTFVFFGGSGGVLDTTPDATINGPQNGARAGSAIGN